MISSDFLQAPRRFSLVLTLAMALGPGFAFGQGSESRGGGSAPPGPGARPQDLGPDPSGSAISPHLRDYYDPVQGVSLNDLVRRALASNAELAAARLDVERARARLRQAALRPNPTIDVEHTTGWITGSTGERETSLGFSLPVELGRKRERRVELARAELEAAETEIADRERRLTAELFAGHGEALAALRELETAEQLKTVDLQTARIVEARVTEGESAPLELNLLRVEADRLQSRRALVEGRLQAALLRLKALAGMAPGDSLRLREDLTAPSLVSPAASLDSAIDLALRTRPDLRLARLIQEVAEAGFRLAHSQAVPDVVAFTRYSFGQSVFDRTAVGVLRDRDTLLSFGVSIGIPISNRNQGAKAEAAAAIAQARARREFAETLVRSEVASAYARYEAARLALAAFEQGVLPGSAQNVRSIRGAYEVGAFRITDLLVEQRRFVDLQREYTEVLAERYRALADLTSAIGAPIK